MPKFFAAVFWTVTSLLLVRGETEGEGKKGD